MWKFWRRSNFYAALESLSKISAGWSKERFLLRLMDQYVEKLQKEKEEKEKSIDLCQELSRSDQTFLSLDPAAVCAEDIWKAKGGDIMRTDGSDRSANCRKKIKKL